MSKQRSAVGLERQLVLAVINQLRIQANKRAIALRREARHYWKDARKYRSLQDRAVEAQRFSDFVASLQEPDDYVFKGSREEEVPK